MLGRLEFFLIPGSTPLLSGKWEQVKGAPFSIIFQFGVALSCKCNRSS